MVMDELKKALDRVTDKYDDFFFGMYSILKNDEENRQKVINYINNNPDKKSDDIIESMDELGI